MSITKINDNSALHERSIGLSAFYKTIKGGNDSSDNTRFFQNYYFYT